VTAAPTAPPTEDVQPDPAVAPAFRIWLGVEVLFGVLTLLSLGRFPEETADRFAWPIEPTVMATALGAFYLALTPLLVLALVARRWANVRVVVLPALAFTTAELIATLLHWDKFSVGTAPFAVGLVSYVLPPPLFLAGYLWHERRSGTPSRDDPLPAGLRTVLLVAGGLLTVEAVVALVHPAWLIDSFPWTRTPLTARVLAGWLLLVGTLLLSMAREGDRTRVRLVSPFLVVVLPALVVQVLRYGSQVDAGSPRLWIGLVLFGGLAGCGVVLVRGDWRAALR
jgi:hypothetical protein